jgi:DNA mismatch repair ATPase MutS
MLPYLIGIFIIVAIVIVVLNRLKIAKQQKQLEDIRAEWGQPKTGELHFRRISRYSEIVNKDAYHQLSDQTIFDIDFYNLFGFIDRTTSKIGQQHLFKKLKHPSNSPETLRQFDTLANVVANNPTLRESLQLDLIKLSHADAYSIASLLQDNILEKPSWFRFLFLNIAILFTMLLLSIKYPVLLIFTIIPVTINIMLHYWNKSNTFQFSRSFPQLNILIAVAKSLSKKDVSLKNPSVDHSVSALLPFQRKMALLNWGQNESIRDELASVASYFIELIKGIFLVEVFTVFHLAEKLESEKDSIHILFEYTGEIDAAIAVASLRAGKIKTCTPEFVSGQKTLETKQLHHPLVENCAKNDLLIDNSGILITGSNMSGKTTFLRTLIINSILAQTIYTCFADSFKAPIMKQFSSIRIDDNLQEGTSYYLEEVNIVASMIGEAQLPQQNLFILDEVFKGTNSVERIAAGKAILSYLNSTNNIVVVSTHDVALAELLKGEYDLYHFSETIENNQLHFDHQLKPGALKTRNAIRILEILNYPKEITTEANRLSKALS